MKWVRDLLVIAFLLGFALPAFSESELIILAPGQTATVHCPDVVAVFARDSAVARVSLGDDSVTVRGVRPGETEIVVFIGYHRIEEITVRCVVLTGQTSEQQQPVNQQRTTPDSAAFSALSGQPPAEKLNSIPGSTREENPTPESDLSSDKASVPNISQEPLPGAISRADEHHADEFVTNAAETPAVTLAEKSLSLRESSQL